MDHLPKNDSATFIMYIATFKITIFKYDPTLLLKLTQNNLISYSD